MKKIAYAFCGTPQIAVEAFEQIIPELGLPQFIITNEDKPQGRGKKLLPSPVKAFGIDHQISVLQPQSLRETSFLQIVEQAQLQLIITCAFGKFFPQKLLQLPQWGCWNIHYSLLPKFRGAAPLQYALLNGQQQTGITIFEMVREMDAGPIWSQTIMPLQDNDNMETLYHKITRLIQPAIHDAIEAKLAEQQPIPQRHDLATFAPKIEKEMLIIDWQQPASQIHNQIRAFSPVPGAYSLFGQDKRLKILTSSVIHKDQTSNKEPGTIIHVEKDQGFHVACGQGILHIAELQPPNKKRMSAYAFLLGHDLKKLG